MFLYFQIAALSFDPDEDENEEEEEEECDIEIKKEVEDTSLKKKRLGEQSWIR